MKNRIKKIIELSSLNTKEFAKSIGASPGNVGDWLAGRSEPGSKMLRSIYKKYKINPLWLLTGDGSIRKYPEVEESFTGNIFEEERDLLIKKERDDLIKKMDELQKQLQDHLKKYE